MAFLIKCRAACVPLAVSQSRRACVRAVSTYSARPALGSDEHLQATERRLRQLFGRHGGEDYIGEPVSITQHCEQAAAAAAAAGESEEVQIAALLHDLGHLLGLEAGFAPAMDGCGTVDHELVGANFVRKLGFSDTVGYLQEQHVNAKRYLCAVNPEYHEKLSEASRTTLRHQGGPMTQEAAAAAAADPRWPTVLKMRSFDEAGKDPTAKVPTLDDFMPRILQHVQTQAPSALASEYASTYLLSDEQLRRWDEDGMLVVRGAFGNGLLAALPKMADELAALHSPGAPEGPWLTHAEAIDGKGQLTRVENFCHHLPSWRQLCFGVVQDLVSQVYREEAVLFKDKINFKGPGGAGFLCHQDATAYATEDLASRHVSALVAVDAATAANGCLQVAPGKHNSGIFPNVKGVLTEEAQAALSFVDVLVQPGDIVLFDSFLPHKSATNTTNGWRRSAYLTFNRASEGDHHTAYYAKKADVFRQGSGGSISINDDFAGKIIGDTRAFAEKSDTHL